MKIAILGATGNVGGATVDQAVAAGHDVVAYVRRPEAVAGGRQVRVVGGQLDDIDALTEAIRGSDSLIVSITGPMRDTTFARRTTPPIIAAAREAGVGQVILVSVFGAGASASAASAFAGLVYKTALRGFLADKAAAERLFAESDLSVTTVYPVNLKDEAPNKNWVAIDLAQVSKIRGLPTSSYGNVAQALIAVATQPVEAGRQVVVTTPKALVRN